MYRAVCFKLLAHSDTHEYPIRHATRGLFTIPKSRTDYGRCTVLHRAMTAWNIIPYQVTDASSRVRFKKTDTNKLYGTAGMLSNTYIGTDPCIHMMTYALYTHVYVDYVL